MTAADPSNQFVEQAPTPAVLVRADCTLEAHNDHFASLLDNLDVPITKWGDLIHHDDRDRFRSSIETAIANEQSTDRTVRLRMNSVRAPEHQALVWPAAGGGAAIVLFIKSSSDKDDLTGLPNRLNLIRRLDDVLDDHSTESTNVGVLFIDLDHFKVVNDSLGHSAGDDLLQIVATRIVETIRPEDVVARLGGDEFVVILPGISNDDDSAIAAERIRRAIAKPIELGGRPTVVTASIGIALADGTQTSSELIRDADTALYRAKDLGRDRASLFDDLLRERAVRRHNIEQQIRAALESSSIRVHYQPTIRASTGELVGVEALLRLDGHEAATPEDTVDIAEESGLIGRVGQTVLDQALRDAALWNRDSTTPIEVSVNVSPRQLTDHRFPTVVATALSTHGVDPPLLSLEITERALIHAGDKSSQVLDELAELGVGLGLDDFGTGFSSLTYLKRYPVTFVKIDKSFVSGIGVSDDDTAIVQATIALAQSLGLHVLAEGVENETQREILEDFGCDRMQGFLYSPPTDATGIARLIDSAR